MSWAEIKKAVNSNIDVPLNSYLESDLNNNLKVYYGRTDNDDNDLKIEINGKCLIHSIYAIITLLSGVSQSLPHFYIQVDGVEKVYFRSVGNYYQSIELAMFDLQHPFVGNSNMGSTNPSKIYVPHFNGTSYELIAINETSRKYGSSNVKPINISGVRSLPYIYDLPTTQDATYGMCQIPTYGGLLCNNQFRIGLSGTRKSTSSADFYKQLTVFCTLLD